MADTGDILKAQMEDLTEKILWSLDALNTFLSLVKGEELSWTARLPASSQVSEEVQPFIWTAYFTVKDYLNHAYFEVSDAYVRDLILKIAKQLAEDAESGTGYALSSRSESSSSLSVSFASGNGKAVSEVENLLKSLDQFKKLTALYEEDRY